MSFSATLFIILFLITASSETKNAGEIIHKDVQSQTFSNPLLVAKLGYGLKQDFLAIRTAFRNNNPGYDIEYFKQIYSIDPKSVERILFLQGGGGVATISTGDYSRVSVGDIILLHKQEILTIDSLIDVLAFTVPESPGYSVPRFIRPDWDPNITDTPGGCAKDTGAYRRILLTWLDKDGPYQYHKLNAHRVRITDSFTHYHPADKGFDELYLVQMAKPGAILITSEKPDMIQNYNQLTREDLSGLLQKTLLEVGDLVYIPKGIAHRGYGGVLVQVITIPGFIPDATIGIDQMLYQINRKFNLTGPDSLTFNMEALKEQVGK